MKIKENLLKNLFNFQVEDQCILLVFVSQISYLNDFKLNFSLEFILWMVH